MIDLDCTKLNGYTLVEIIGVGGQTDVYKGVCGDNVSAFKIAREYFALINLRVESVILEKLADLSFVPCIQSASITDRPYYLQMNYIKGVDLHDYVSGGSTERMGRSNPDKINPEDAAELMYKITYNLREIHNHGILHLDLKPSNIILKDKEVHIIDFGISEDYSGSKVIVRGPIGHVSFLPKEAWQSLPLTQKTDIFGLGATYYFVRTADLPYDIRNHIINGRLPDMSCLEEKEERLIASMLAPNPKDRPTTSEVISGLEEII